MRGIITYHSIDDSGSVISIDPGTFRRHVEWLASGVVQVTTLEELPELPAETDAVALTFDDGFENFDAQAWPLLKDHGLPATLFVVTERAGGTNEWEEGAGSGIPLLPLLGWDRLAKLAGEGLFLGSHSRTHPHLAQLTEEQLTEEIETAARQIDDKIGARPRPFCYPYGEHDSRVVRAVSTRHRLACTTELRFLGEGDNPHLLPRLDAYYLRDPGRLESWVAGSLGRYIKVRALGRKLRRLI